MNAHKNLVTNTRFYILATAMLSSISILAFFRTKFPSDQLYYIRSEQLFGLSSVVLVYLAIIITPLSKLVPRAKGLKQVLFARRGIGVAAAYFASLHVFISVQKQLMGIDGALLLPTRYKVSFGLATIALLILLSMALTSFDKAIDLLSFKRWKRIHRFVYLAGVLIVIHIWLIGTHVEYAPIRYATYAALSLLIILESFRFAQSMGKKWQLDDSVYIAAAIGFALLGLVSLVLLPVIAQDYHTEHSGNEIQFHGHGEAK